MKNHSIKKINLASIILETIFVLCAFVFGIFFYIWKTGKFFTGLSSGLAFAIIFYYSLFFIIPFLSILWITTIILKIILIVQFKRANNDRIYKILLVSVIVNFFTLFVALILNILATIQISKWYQTFEEN